MSSKQPRSRATDWAVYLVIRWVVCLVRILPQRLAYSVADSLAWLAYKIDKRHREVARENLRHAFPEWAASPGRIDAVVRGVYRHFFRVLMDGVHLPARFRGYTYSKQLTMKGGEHLMDALTGERAVLLVTGHFGHWELSSFALGGFGFRTFAIARVLDNPYLERFVKQFRQHTGQTILAKKGDFDRITDVLSSNGVICTLADQDAGQKGLYVDFFNRPASTHKAVALMALESNAVMVVLGTPRVAEPDVYQAQIVDVIRPEEYAGQADAVKKITQRYTQALEGLIRQYPEQYFWLHRRWKHQPKAKRAAA